MSDSLAAPVVEMTDISISFPGVKALDSVNFRMYPGEVHSLMGENGAGKSTLIKALTGVYEIDSGTILLGGQPLSVTGPAQAQEAGISTVYQEINLLSNLSVAENIMLGREHRRFGLIDWKSTRRHAAKVLEGLSLDIDPASPLSSHSLAVQQLVAIARAIDIKAKVLILDEPTSSLDADEVAELFRIIRRLKNDGVAVLFVSHFLDQVYEIADRLTVLRNGSLVGEYRTEQILRIELVHKMIGKDIELLEKLETRTKASAEAGVPATEPFLAAEGIGRKGSVEPTSLSLQPGEIVGLAGLLGSGRTELARLISGVDRAETGTLLVAGQQRRFRSPRAALKDRIAYSSEDRKHEGIVDDLSVRDNIVLALQSDRGWFRQIPKRRQEELAASYISALGIRPADPNTLVRNLSGGNQQKVLLARWLAVAPRLLVLDEPTRGIDVGAKAEIQRLIANLAEEGMSVLFISAELEEVLRLSHRVAVMRDRRKVADFVNDDVTVGEIMALIASGSDDETDAGEDSPAVSGDDAGTMGAGTSGAGSESGTPSVRTGA
ncbi:sugar ABC transporter ATP-binding protein [Homoserinimonas hongtaonis]|uniref:sugar ABC transporter ATP-binding protein n=1 Tax=Homoserinimonas hongtaonis TaxID=2079791 RepID=UPI0018EF6B49|nr:sugar ABC transporter ATP-binding protein [Salinibacterium hongtaonis]